MLPQGLKSCTNVARAYLITAFPLSMSFVIFRLHLSQMHHDCVLFLMTPSSGEKVLVQVEQLQCQLQSLKAHMIAHDRCSNCFTRWVGILSQTSHGGVELINPPDASTGRQHWEKHSHSQLFAKLNLGTEGSSACASVPTYQVVHKSCNIPTMLIIFAAPSTTIGLSLLSRLQMCLTFGANSLK